MYACGSVYLVKGSLSYIHWGAPGPVQVITCPLQEQRWWRRPFFKLFFLSFLCSSLPLLYVSGKLPMSTHMLKSLTNREYDDYVNQRLSRLEQQADLFRSFLATTEDPIMIDDNSRSHNNNQRSFRRSNSSSSSQHHNERASLPIRRRPSTNDNSRRRRRMPSHENLPYLYHEQVSLIHAIYFMLQASSLFCIE